MKKCSRCGIEYPATTEFFYIDSKYLASRCKKCDRERGKEYREEHKEYFEQKKAEYYQENKEEQNKKYKQNKIDAMENSPSNLSYAGLHDLIARIKSRPEICEMCYKPKRLELASIDHTYTEDPMDWKYLCRECHVKFDKRSKPEEPEYYCEDCDQYLTGEQYMIHNADHWIGKRKEPPEEKPEQRKPFYDTSEYYEKMEAEERDYNIYHLTVIIDNKEDFYSFLKGHEVIDLIKKIEEAEEKEKYEVG